MGCAFVEVRDFMEHVARLEASLTGRCSLLEGLRINSQPSDHLEHVSKELWWATYAMVGSISPCETGFLIYAYSHINGVMGWTLQPGIEVSIFVVRIHCRILAHHREVITHCFTNAPCQEINSADSSNPLSQCKFLWVILCRSRNYFIKVLAHNTYWICVRTSKPACTGVSIF